MPKPFLWIDKEPPTPGWYATLKCWDSHEGYFPDSNYWDGEHWAEDRPMVTHHSPGIFKTPEEAKDWAYEHDPEW